MIPKLVANILSSGQDLLRVLLERAAKKVESNFAKMDAAKKANKEREERDKAVRLDLRCEPENGDTECK